MRCENCGVDLLAGAAFCPSCGKPAGPSHVPHATQPTSGANAGLKSNMAGALCYLGGFITGIIFLVLEPYRQDRFVRFHAFQSIFLNVAWIVLYIGLGIVIAILPGSLWSVTWMLHSLLDLGMFALWLLLMYKAYQNEHFKLPVLGDLADRQAGDTKSAPRAAA